MVPLSFGCGSAVLAAIATLAPSRAARSAIDRPMPRLPPDMNSVLALRDVLGLLPVVYQMVATGAHRHCCRFWNPNTLTIRMQHPAAGFRQGKGSEEEHAIG